MVMAPLRISALNRKLWRDLLAMKGQALAIAMVVAAGVSVYVMYLSNFASLQSTRAAYYSQQRFADVFASLKRAPRARRQARLPICRMYRRSRHGSWQTSRWTWNSSRSRPRAG